MSKFIKEWLWEVKKDEKPEPAQPVQQPKSAPVVYQDSAAPSSYAAPTSPNVNYDDSSAFTKHFDELFKKSNLPGPDYYELITAVEAMADQVPQENVRFIAAFAALSPNGLTKDKINSSAANYIGIIDKEKADFEEEFKQAYNTAVAQAKSLNAQYAALQTQIGELQTKIQSLGFKEQGFLTAADEAKKKIQDDLTKVNQYIK